MTQAKPESAVKDSTAQVTSTINASTTEAEIVRGHPERQPKKADSLLEVTIDNDERATMKGREEADSAPEGRAHSQFEKKLFETGEVDYRTYIEVKRLFEAFNEEAKSGVDIRYHDYQECLLTLLLHCYGYFYTLMTDTERYRKDIEVINSRIRPFNKNSNKDNSLSSKIIKLVWNGQLDRKRISTYSKVLDNAWVKGKPSHYTDRDGRVLPEFFVADIRSHGGINDYSRLSKGELDNKARLEKEGYTCAREKKLDKAGQILRSEKLIYNDKAFKISPPFKAQAVSPDFSNFHDGEIFTCLAKWDEQNSQVGIFAFYEEKDSITEKAKLTFYEALKKEAIRRDEG